MADQVTPKQADDTKMTAADAKFFATMFKYLPKNMAIPWDDFAKEMNLKNGLVAKTRCRQIRTKLGHFGPTGDKSESSSPTKPIGATKVSKRRGKQPKRDPAIKEEFKEEDLTDGEV